MLTTLLAAVLLVSAMEPLSCDGTGQIPKEVRPRLPIISTEEQKVIVEVIEESVEGYISSLFLVTEKCRIYLEGWFYIKDRELVMCDISKFHEIDNEGRLMYLWFFNQKEM